ncbi:MAG: hypothetical protein FJ286_11180 [Planctomycetes bacterium]|nr:hypothetical protein [Planctomycetota bacterium]
MAILDVEGDDMVSVPEIRNRLQPVFTEPQADLLANVLVETHAELVTRGDFHRLTCTVEELAEAQKRTEHRVEQLAETQLEMQHAITELGTHVTGLTRQVGDLAKQVGGLSNAVGANLEDFACELVPELLEKYWRLATTSAGPEELALADGTVREFDVVVRGTIDDRPVVVVCETKATVSTTEVSKFLRIVEKVRAAHPGEDVRPLFFGYKANAAARALIVEAGAAMVFTRGVMIPAA